MNKNLTVGLWLTGIMLTLILVGFFWTPYNPETMDNAAKLSGVSFSHLMGCDNFGRDIFSRVLKGGGTTFFVALGTVAIGTVFGVIIGAFTGYFGGILDEVLMRINDVLFAFPSILLALIFISLTKPGSYNIILALGILFIPSFARIVRSEVIRCRELDFVKSARILGAGHIRIIFAHILPNAAVSLLTLKAMLSVGYRIPKKKILLSTGTPKQKVDMLEAARMLQKKGYDIFATGGSSKFLTENGVENTRVYWPSEEGHPQALEMLHKKEIDMVVNIPKNLTAGELDNGYKIRRAAIDLNIPLITNARLASAFINAFCTMDIDDIAIKSWEEYK